MKGFCWKNISWKDGDGGHVHDEDSLEKCEMYDEDLMVAYLPVFQWIRLGQLHGIVLT